jgi:hypothetical protein
MSPPSQPPDRKGLGDRDPIEPGPFELQDDEQTTEIPIEELETQEALRAPVIAPTPEPTPPARPPERGAGLSWLWGLLLILGLVVIVVGLRWVFQPGAERDVQPVRASQAPAAAPAPSPGPGPAPGPAPSPAPEPEPEPGSERAPAPAPEAAVPPAPVPAPAPEAAAPPAPAPALQPGLSPPVEPPAAVEPPPLELSLAFPRRALRNSRLQGTVDTGRSGCAVQVHWKPEGAGAWRIQDISGPAAVHLWELDVTAEHRPAILYHVTATGCGEASAGSASAPMQIVVR